MRALEINIQLDSEIGSVGLLRIQTGITKHGAETSVNQSEIGLL